MDNYCSVTNTIINRSINNNSWNLTVNYVRPFVKGKQHFIRNNTVSCNCEILLCILEKYFEHAIRDEKYHIRFYKREKSSRNRKSITVNIFFEFSQVTRIFDDMVRTHNVRVSFD